MNSTESELRRAAISEFFSTHLMPISKTNQALERSYFPDRFDASAESYFRKRVEPEMQRKDFEFPTIQNSEDLEKALAMFWQNCETPELIPLARPLARLAELLRVEEEQNEEVSPFIYVMF